MAISNHWFDQYKKKYSDFKTYQINLLFQTGNVSSTVSDEGSCFYYRTTNCYLEIRPFSDKLKDLEEKVLTEISTNVLELSATDQRRIYLSLVQSFLDGEYDHLEAIRSSDSSPMHAYEPHPSIVSIQNHVRKLYRFIEGQTNYSVGLETLSASRQGEEDFEVIPMDVDFWSAIPRPIVEAFVDKVVSITRNSFHFYCPEHAWIKFLNQLEKGFWLERDGTPLNDITVNPYLAHYHRGFIKGYKVFDGEIEERGGFKASEEEQIAGIIKSINTFATKAEFPTAFSLEGSKSNVDPKLWETAGRYAGRYYRAWQRVLQAPDRFIDRFTVPPPPAVETKKTLADIFINPDDVQHCVQALIKTGIISANHSYLLGNRKKGSITAWVEALKKKNKIRQDVPRKEITQLLNDEFRDLELGADGRSLSDLRTSGFKKYYQQILLHL